VRSWAVPSRATCQPDQVSEYSSTQTGVGVWERAGAAFLPFQALDQREITSQPAPAICQPSIASHPPGDTKQLRQPRLLILVLTVTVLMMTAPGLIGGLAVLNTSFTLSPRLSTQVSSLISLASYVVWPIDLVLVFMVWRAPSEQ
jgi:hypothetical protein